jgi:acyl-CoA thioesterase-1
MVKSILKNLLFILRHKVAPTKKPFVYVAIGDSTVEGIGASKPERNFASLIYASLKQDIKNAQFHNLGIAGDRVEDVLKKQVERAVELKPDLIVLSVGANDIMQHRKLGTFKKEYNQLIEQLNQTKALIVVTNVPDLSLAPVLPKYALPYCKIQVPRFNGVIKHLVHKYGVVFVDLYQQSQLFHGYSELISADGLHPSDAGYALWANTIITKISPLIFNLA